MNHDLYTKIILFMFFHHILAVKQYTYQLINFPLTTFYSESIVCMISAMFFVIIRCFSGVHNEIMYWRSRSNAEFTEYGSLYKKSFTVTCITSAISVSFCKLGFFRPLSMLLIYAGDVFI